MTELKVVVYEGNHQNEIKLNINKSLSAIKPADVDYAFVENIVLQYIIDNDFLLKNGMGGLRFVGTFYVKTDEYKILVYALPKYLAGVTDSFDNPNRYMVSIRKVIERTNHLFDYDIKDAEFSPYEYQTTKSTVSRYDIAKWLVSDYRRNGIFSIKEKKHSIERKGRIAWNRTILKNTPIIEDDMVVYANPISTYITRNDKLLLSDIHRCAVKEALEDLGEEASLTVEPLYREELLGHLKQFSSEIKRYQRLVFQERDILLLRYLEAWCLTESNYYMRPVGTVSFELVWEDVIRGVFGHKGLNEKVGFGAPIYYIGGKGYPLKGDSIPDAMNFWNDNGKIGFVVIDGKYYLGEIENGKAKYLPGYKDIAKQIDYFETLVKVYGLESNYGRNIFIMPKWDKLCGREMDCSVKPIPFSMRYIGYVIKPKKVDPIKSIIDNLNKSIVDERNNDKYPSKGNSSDKVYIIQVEPEEMYQTFLKGCASTEAYAKRLCEYVDEKEQYEDLREQYLDSKQMEIWEKSNILYKTLFYYIEISKVKPDLEYSKKAVDSYMKLPCYNKWNTKDYGGTKGVRLIITSNEPNKEPVEVAADIMTGWWYPFKYFMGLDKWPEMGEAIEEYKRIYDVKDLNAHIRKIYLNKLYKLQAIDSDEDTLVEWMVKKSKRSRASCQACLEFLKVVYTEGNMIPIIENFHSGKSLDGWDYKMINIVDEGYNTAQAEKWRAYVKTYFGNVDNFVKANHLEDYYVDGKVCLLWSKDKPFNGFCEANEEEWKEYFTNAKERIVKRNEKLKKYD